MSKFQSSGSVLSLLVLLLLHISVPCFAFGGDVGNGGDTLRCAPSDANPFNGLYSLDYMLMYNPNVPDEMVPIKTWEESKKRILDLIYKNCRTSGHSRWQDQLQAFYDLQTNETDWTKSYIWRPSVYGLVDIQDERMSRLVPPNCKKPDGRPDIIQSVIRHENPEAPDYIIVFEYDPQILTELKTRDPLQYSFLIHHEFLWNYIQDINKLRWMNSFLHSKKAQSLSPDEFGDAIRAFGVSDLCWH